jgi:hypothetical protein
VDVAAGDTLCVPEVALLPLQEPLATQDVAFVVVHVSRLDAPTAMVAGAAVRFTTTGGGVAAICTVTERVTLPPVPVHMSVNVVAVVMLLMTWLLLTALVPLQPPEAVQLVALVEFQDSVEDAPEATVAGFALSASVGAGGAACTVTMAVLIAVCCCAFVHVSVYEVFAFTGPTDCEPETAFAPAQPSEAVQVLAPLEVQVSVTLEPGVTVVGLATRLTEIVPP